MEILCSYTYTYFLDIYTVFLPVRLPLSLLLVMETISFTFYMNFNRISTNYSENFTNSLRLFVGPYFHTSPLLTLLTRPKLKSVSKLKCYLEQSCQDSKCKVSISVSISAVSHCGAGHQSTTALIFLSTKLLSGSPIPAPVRSRRPTPLELETNIREV